MPNYIIAAGSCHYQGQEYLIRAKELLKNYNNMLLCGESRIIKNASQGMKIKRLFFNCAFAISAYLEPRAFYRELKTIEYELGRIRSYKNAPRTIDLDVLMSFDLIYNSSTFKVPHRDFYTRDFFVNCAVEAIKCASWPVPISLIKAKAQLGRNHLPLCS